MVQYVSFFRGLQLGLRRTVFSVLLPGLLLSACSSAPTPTVEPSVQTLEISTDAASLAADLLEAGTAIEPRLTALLVEGAERIDVQLYGLEHRVKSQGSLERKIQTKMLDGVAATDAVIEDVLRYTVLLEDEPPGRYNDAVADILSRAEARGFPVRKVKNYWPSGDTYSGINCVLETPNGILWELQFHTYGSLAAKSEGHELYEEFRLPTTPLRRQRELFDRMVERWDWVKIPEGILEPHSVHEREEIILRSRP